MKEQIHIAILPELPIVGTLKLTSFDGKTLASISVVRKSQAKGMTPFFKSCHKEFERYLTGKTKKISLPLDLNNLTPFHARVLSSMARIPYGAVARYKDLANDLKTKGYQAIGTACGRNPFLLIYPCHRVVGATDLGGFAHGLQMKKALLRLEGFQI